MGEGRDRRRDGRWRVSIWKPCARGPARPARKEVCENEADERKTSAVEKGGLTLDRTDAEQDVGSSSTDERKADS